MRTTEYTEHTEVKSLGFVVFAEGSGQDARATVARASCPTPHFFTAQCIPL